MRSPGFAIDSYQRAGEEVLVLRGELDLASVPVFAQLVIGALTEEIDSVLLDLDELQFIDSSGLRALLSARTVCVERGRRFAITRPRGQLARLLEVTGTAHLLPIDDATCAPISGSRFIRLWPLAEEVRQKG